MTCMTHCNNIENSVLNNLDWNRSVICLGGIIIIQRAVLLSFSNLCSPYELCICQAQFTNSRLRESYIKACTCLFEHSLVRATHNVLYPT